jgi:AcrR family transcriptional regulator
MPTKESSATRASYHHGDLRHALLTAGIELAREGGPDAVVLREATRRVGVSPNAAYRHFADREALLADVCDAAQATLAAAIDEKFAAVPSTDAPPTSPSRSTSPGSSARRSSYLPNSPRPAPPELARAAVTPSTCSGTRSTSSWRPASCRRRVARTPNSSPGRRCTASRCSSSTGRFAPCRASMRTA